MDDGANRCPSGLDLFWEQADAEALGEHPLQRELDHRVDALARYRAMIVEAHASGREHLATLLKAEHDREQSLARRLRHELARLRRGDGAA